MIIGGLNDLISQQGHRVIILPPSVLMIKEITNKFRPRSSRAVSRGFGRYSGPKVRRFGLKEGCG